MSQPDKLTIEEVEEVLSREEEFTMPPGDYALYQQLFDTMRENERLRGAIGNLEPLRDIDWHGKWRIHSCLDALSNKASTQPDKHPESDSHKD